MEYNYIWYCTVRFSIDQYNFAQYNLYSVRQLRRALLTLGCARRMRITPLGVPVETRLACP